MISREWRASALYDVIRGLGANRNFVVYLVAGTSSTLGTVVMQIAIAFALLEKGYSTGALGDLYAAESLPMFALLLIGGVVSDRYSRRNTLIISDWLRCVSQIILAGSLLVGHPPIMLLIGISGLVGIGDAFSGPAAMGLLPNIVVRSRLAMANNVINMMSSVAVIVGPLLGGYLIRVGGAPLAVLIDALTYGLSGAILCFLRPPNVAVDISHKLSFDCRAAVAELMRHAWLLVVTVQLAVLGVFAFSPFAVIGPAVVNEHGNGAEAWGIVAASSGIGGLLGGGVLLHVRISRPLLVFELCYALAALPVASLALFQSILVLAAASAVGGGVCSVMSIVVTSAMQKEIPDARLGRVSAIVGVILLGVSPIGLTLCGPASDYFGAERTLLFGASVVALTVPIALIFQGVRAFRG